MKADTNEITKRKQRGAMVTATIVAAVAIAIFSMTLILSGK